MCYECSDTQDCLDPFNSINNANYLKACAYGQTCQVYIQLQSNILFMDWDYFWTKKSLLFQ